MTEDSKDSNANDAEAQERKRLHEMLSQRAWQDMQDSSDQFDKQLLTISSGALGISLAFVKDIVPVKEAQEMAVLFFSWMSFLLCILLTASSFLFSMQAQRLRIEHLRFFYLDKKNEYFDKKTIYMHLLDWCRYLGIVFLLLGLGLTIRFCYTNLVRAHL